MGFLKQVNKRPKTRYSFELKTMGNESSFYDGKNNSRKKIIIISLTAVVLLGTLYLCVGYLAHPEHDAALTSAVESTTEFSKKLGGNRKYFMIFGVVVILLACHKYEIAKKIIKSLKGESSKTPPAPPPENEVSMAATAGIMLTFWAWTAVSAYSVFELAELAGISAISAGTCATAGVVGVATGVSLGGIYAIGYLFKKFLHS